MSAQTPPSVILFPSINYNPAFFDSATGGSFLNYPIAQGTETLQTINVNGQSNFNDNVYINNNPTTKSLIFHDATTSTNASLTNTSSYLTLTSATIPISDNSDKVATTAWVNTFSKPASTMLITTTTSNATYYLPIITANTTANYPMFVSSTIGINPQIGTISCPGVSASAFLTSPLINTTSGGTIRITSTTGNYSQFQQSSVGYDLNITMANQGALNILSGLNYGLPTGTNSTTAALGIGWNATNGGGEADFVNYSQGSSTGGFNFYNIGGANAIALIAQIPRTQPPTTDNSTKLATTAWVKSVLPNPMPYLTYYSTAPINPSGTIVNTFAVITNVPQNAFTQVSGVIPPSYKFRISFDLYSTDYLIAYSFSGVVDIYPSRLTNTNPVVAGNTSYGGSYANNNLTNAIAGLSTSYNYTNATYSPYNRFYWTSCQNGGFFSGGNTTWLFINALWTNAVGGTSDITLNTVISGYNATPTALNPTNGFSLSQTAMYNYTTEFLGTNTSGGTVTLY